MINIKSPMVVFKAIFIILLLIYVKFFDITISTNKIDAITTLIFSLWFLYKSRKSLPVCLIAFLILYCNYSIVMGEYLIGGSLGVPVYTVKTVVNYGISIRTLLLFISTIAVFYNGKTINLSKFKLIPKDNILIFYSLFLVLVYILLFGVSRGDLISYSVRISTLYEYSTLLFLFAYYYSGKSLIRRFLIVSLIVLFVLQDFYYGGRVTSMQLILLLSVTIFAQRLSLKFILLGGFVGIIMSSLVGAYRSSYSLGSANFLSIFTNLKNSYFVFSTPVYAYYASNTHIAAAQIVGLDIKLNAFVAFIVSIFFGSKSEISNLTPYISHHYFYNMGGGIIPTHFYFWLGWTGVITISIVLALIMNNLGGFKSDFQKLCSLVVIITVPRWYLYSPLSLFRPLIFLSILYLIFLLVHKVLSGIPSSRLSLNVNEVAKSA